MRSHWQDGDHLRSVDLAALGGGRFQVSVDDGVAFEIAVQPMGDGTYRIEREGGAVLAIVTPAGSRRFVRLGLFDFVLERAATGTPGRSRSRAGGGLESPMPGVVTRVLVKPGEAVTKGQPLLAVEAMKMEHVIRAPRDGTVRGVRAAAGEMVSPGVALVELDGEPA